MLVISREQMKALEQVPLRQFENDLLDHLHQYFPKHWEIISPESLHQVIRLGLSRAIDRGAGDLSLRQPDAIPGQLFR